MKKKILFITLLCLSFILMACGDEDENADNGTANNEQVVVDSGEESEQAFDIDEVINSTQVDKDETVATVNGEDIKGAEYNLFLGQTVSMLQQYGQDASDEALVKEHTLNAAITQTLLSQEIEKAGMEASGDELEDMMSRLQANFETDEEFQNYLDEQLQLTEQQLEEQVVYEIKVQKYINTQITDVEVTDQEIEEYYEMVSSQSEDVPALSEVKPQIEQELLNQKKNSKLSEKIEQLKEEADIETLI